MKNKTIMGVSAGFHDAGVSVVDGDGNILFAGHSERYSKVKNDATLNPGIMDEALGYGMPAEIAWYERPWLKKTRQIYSGEWRKALSDKSPRAHLSPYFDDILVKSVNIDSTPTRRIRTYSHHLSHAAAGFQTSPFEEAMVVVIDAIGEWDTITAWRAWYDDDGHARYQRVYRQLYPHSLGLFYSAMTHRIGLKPMEEEYILMGMAAYGTKDAYRDVWEMAIDQDHKQKFKRNFHTGIEYEFGAQYGKETLARATQLVTERFLGTFMRQLAGTRWGLHLQNCVFMGGVALNCVANSHIRDIWNDMWIMPNPGDCGSSLGAAALAYGKKLNWQGPYLGTNIPGEYPSEEIIGELQREGIVGVASGRAEFGPRALGNRSLLADPRGEDIKDRVNEIKRRQKFRPFAPMILEEHAEDYFVMDGDKSPYMQHTYRCKYPERFPAIVHYDGTSRVQTVGKDDKTGARDLLEKWYVLTDCPMLLNTSLNIRGEPMVNDRTDADRFEKKYGVRVCS
jgi:carbamoyltransferase